MYIDIHNHSLYGVDDGAESMEETVMMLRNAKADGARAVIFTPHFRHGMFPYNKEVILAHFEIVKKYGEQMELPVFLGCEYHVDSEILDHLKNKRVMSLGDTEYVLTEYRHDTPYSFVVDYTRLLISAGYRPVLAHVERYNCFLEDVKRLIEIQNMGGMVQMNADSILGEEGRRLAKFCKQALKLQAVDIVASDAHGIHERVNHMGECEEYVTKKYGEAYARYLFEINPKKILNDAMCIANNDLE